MTKGTFNIKIDGITEQQFIESCLNYKCSGYEPLLFFMFYALAKRMDICDFTYYSKLLEGVEE